MTEVMEQVQKKLAKFADRNKLRRDWHEPDEQGCSAGVTGCILDNAGYEDREMTVHLFCGKHHIQVNLATLLAIASFPARK